MRLAWKQGHGEWKPRRALSLETVSVAGYNDLSRNHLEERHHHADPATSRATQAICGRNLRTLEEHLDHSKPVERPDGNHRNRVSDARHSHEVGSAAHCR